MDQKERELFLMTNKDKFRSEQILAVNELLEKADSMTVYSTEFKSPTAVLIVSVLAGQLGIDRYMLGDKKMGTTKLVSFLLLYVSIFLMCFMAIQSEANGSYRIATILTMTFVAIFFILLLIVTIFWIYDVVTIFGRAKDVNFKCLCTALKHNEQAEIER